MNLNNVQQINKISYNANIYESMHILTHKKKKSAESPENNP